MGKIMKTTSENRSADKVYQCPMKCEGNKTYNSAGNCPVCNMKLVPVQVENINALQHHCC